VAPVKYHYGKFPPTQIKWADLISLIGPANAAIARYDGGCYRRFLIHRSG
jgi:hypothetical protein